MVSRDDFAIRLCRDELPYADATIENRRALIAWMSAEGGPPTKSSPDQDRPQARFNPLNTTLVLMGSTPFNANVPPVRDYVSLAQGLDAVRITLRTHGVGYRAIRRALENGHDGRELLESVEDSDWGTGGLALVIYEEGDVIRERGAVLIGQ